MNKQYDYQKEIQVLGETEDQIQNQRARGVFDVETLELDVLYKTHDTYLDDSCSQHCSSDPVSEIVINEN